MIEVIDTIDRLREFQREWERFERAQGPSNPFQTPEWMLTWWSHFGSGKLHILAFRQGAELVGVLPCFLHRWNGRRQLTLIGTGVTDYLDPLLDARHSAAIVDALVSHLAHNAEWDICHWQDLSADTPLASICRCEEDTPCSHVMLPANFGEFVATLPKVLRRNLRRDRNRAEAIGAVRFESTPDADPELLDALIALHAERWQEVGEPGTIAANRAEGFLREAAAALAGRGMLELFSLRFQERVVAVILAFRANHTLFGYLSAFDPKYAEYSFGREVLAQALSFAHSSGYREWDFLRGEEEYKTAWGTQPIAKRRLILERPWPAAVDQA